MSPFVPCAVIPVYNHVVALDGILSHLAAHDVPVIVVDDGNTLEFAARIVAVCHAHAGVELLRHEFNGGKGFAVLRGVARAHERGFTHALQVDADGQHDLTALAAILETAQRHPAALILGQPRFDPTAPAARRLGRRVTSFWVGVNTLFARIGDTMCGFRAYPVATTLALARAAITSRRMEFDIEFVVRWHWEGLPIATVPVGVSYPEGNTSNFDFVRDNLQISATHARLFFGMLVRAPKLLGRRIVTRGKIATHPDATAASGATHWSDLAERGAFAGLWLLAAAYKILGRQVCSFLLYPVVTYFFLTGREQRRASRDYLHRAWRSGLLAREPSLLMSHSHFQTFGAAALDTFAAWSGRIPIGDIKDVGGRLGAATRMRGRGILVITAHLGNSEVLRAFADDSELAVNVLVHTIHAKRFNQLIERMAPRSRVRVFEVSRIGPDTVIMLSEAVDRGEWVVIAGDRIALGETGQRAVSVPFLGDAAPFPQGPMILAGLLRCSTYLMVCLRDGHRYQVHFEKLTDTVTLPQRNKVDALRAHVSLFVTALERHVAAAPLQWFNFYDFWNPPGFTGSADRPGTSRG